MDLVICEAPLDSSFQKEKLELVNKGSLGRRRKPSRANLKLLLSPSVNGSHSPVINDKFQTTPKPNKPPPAKQKNDTSHSTPITPVCDVPKVIVNGHRDRNTLQKCKSGLKLESSLSQTSETNHYVNDAQQFTIEAKLKRRKSDSGRSAVLIQTWERRTRCDSFTRQSRPKIIARNNRFQNKENLYDTSIMPDCPNGNFKNNQWQNDGGIVSSVRDDYSNGAMVYKKSQNGLTFERTVQTRRSHRNDEPEWISLSKKLRAKFVEGHIEPNSTDSYSYEEPDGVATVLEKQPIQSSNQQIRPPHQSIKSPQPLITSSYLSNQTSNGHVREIVQQDRKAQKKTRVLVDKAEPSSQTEEPPWVQLSRKLCTKFIEEHIEYPSVPNDVPVREASTILERNGDVRIIEKIGKQKGRKSKIRKESEPEWVSLSKKLRAKFIESHIDDPDTISLDNQLNASDPEETSSESLSDSSPQISPKKIYVTSESSENKSLNENKVNLNGNHEINYQYNRSNGIPFAEKECCWEYQEMEFDQESNSGNFQESECFDETVLDFNRPVSETEHLPNIGLVSNHKTNGFISDVKFRTNNRSFVETMNCEPFYNAECYNNDVQFAPRVTDSSDDYNSEPRNKYITVQIVAHPGSNLPNNNNNEHNFLRNSPLSSPSKNSNSDFFNISTWEEAHYRTDEVESAKNPSPLPEINSLKSFKSKSMDNICDANEDNCFESVSAHKMKENKSDAFLLKTNVLSKSETVLDHLDCQIPTNNNFNNLNELKNHLFVNGERDVFESPKRKSQENLQKINIKDEMQNTYYIDFPEEFEDASKSNKAGYDDENLDLKKQPKCNGIIPNQRKDLVKAVNNNNSNKVMHCESAEEIERKKSAKLKDSVTINEYANVNPLTDNNARVIEKSNDSSYLKTKPKSTQSIFENPVDEKIQAEDKYKTRYDYSIVRKHSSKSKPESMNGNLKESSMGDDFVVHSTEQRLKSKSLCDISKQEGFTNLNNQLSNNEGKQSHNGSSQYSPVKSSESPEFDYQHFDSVSDIPLCAKLVSKQNGKQSSSSISSSSNRNASPCSESSHVYEDMFKETTSCPSDSETSSWTVMKNKSYYINGRSSSMNDLDYSDSCSLSMKCDYASSCSQQSTLQSRRSSCTSSSFYVNLRDYDSHMLEPTLSKRRDLNKRVGNSKSSNNINSNPPTPESLRHLFTSPFNSTPHRANRLLNKLPSEPEIHYYSTASAASSAFKLGFDPSPPKSKKTERSSSIKIKDIAHGIILTFRKFQNHSKNSHVSSTHYVDVSHLAQSGSKSHSSDSNKSKTKKDLKDHQRKHERKGLWGFNLENGKTDSDSGCQLSATEAQKTKARRSSSDLTGGKSYLQALDHDKIITDNSSEKKKSKSGKKSSSAREKGKKTRSKSVEPKAIPTVSRKVQQMADGTLYLVTTVSGDTALPGVYSDSPDTSSELSSHKPVKPTGESNC